MSWAFPEIAIYTTNLINEFGVIERADIVEIFAGYDPGSYTDVSAQIDTHHSGLFEFYFCRYTKDLLFLSSAQSL